MAPRPARAWIIGVGVLLLLVQAVGMVLWWKLPTWAPLWVAKHSPWAEPIFRAWVVTDGREGEEVKKHLLRRLIDGGAASQGMLPRWGTTDGSKERIEAVFLALDLLDGSAEQLASSAAVAEALRVLHDDCVAVTMLAFTDSDIDTRIVGIMAAQNLRDGRLVEPLCRELDRSPGTGDVFEQGLLEALRLIGDRRAVPSLLAYGSRCVAGLDESALRACLPATAWEEPLAVLQGNDPRLRAWVVDWLAQGTQTWTPENPHTPRIVSAVIAACADPVPQVRVAAIAAAGDLRFSGAVETLTRLLRHPQALTRQAVVRALAEIGDAAVIPAVLPLLDDVDPDVQRVTAAALGKFGDGRVAEGLLRLAHDHDPDVAIAAVEALDDLPLSAEQRARADKADAALLPPGVSPGRKRNQGGWQTETPVRRP